ncbi:MAG: DUF6279 family lipoprotein [Thiogranum sp.]
MMRFVVITVVVLLGSACSRTDLAYRNSDRLLAYYSWKTVRTSDAQREHWQPLLQATLRYHRESELPLLIAYLDLAGRVVEQRDDSVGAACLVDGALLIYQRHARLAAELAAPLLAELGTDQLRHLAKYTTQRQQDAVKHYLDPDPQRRNAARQKRITERIEKWVGKLNDSQRQQVKDALEKIPDLSAAWLAYRAEHTDTLLAMIANGVDTEALREYLDGWWVRRDGTSAETSQSWDVARSEFIQLMDNITTSLTDTQRARFEKRLGELRDDLAPFLSSPQQPVDLQLVPACASAPV